MWVGFADGAGCGAGDVPTEDDVVEGEGGGGSVGEVRDCEGGGRAAVFVEDNNIA